MTNAIDDVGGAKPAQGAARLLELQRQLMMDTQQAAAAAPDPQDAYKQQETQLKNSLQHASLQMGADAAALALAAQGQGALRQGAAEGRNGLLNALADLLISAAQLQQQLGKLSANNLAQQLNNHLGGSFNADGMFGGDESAASGAGGGGAGVGQQWSAPSIMLIVPAQETEGGAFGKDASAGRTPSGTDLHAYGTPGRNGPRSGRRPGATVSSSGAVQELDVSPEDEQAAAGIAGRLMDETGLTKEQAAAAAGRLLHKGIGTPGRVASRYPVIRQAVSDRELQALLRKAHSVEDAVRAFAQVHGEAGDGEDENGERALMAARRVYDRL